MNPTKRLVDVLISIVIILPAALVCFLFGFFFWASTRQNPVFIQKRVGAGNKPFLLYKLRSMMSGVSDKPTHEINRSDIPVVGKIMRASKIDELPQLINVILGEMSLVGPRPCLPLQSLVIDERTKKGVSDLRPGITGYAQVNGIDMSDAVLLANADLHYLENRSLFFDLSLLFRTICGRGVGDKTQSKDFG